MSPGTAPANCQRAAAGPRVHEGLPGQRAPRAGSRCSFAPCGPVRLGETPPVAPALFRPPPLGRAPHAGAHELRAARTRRPRTRSGHARAQMRRRSPPPHGLRPPGPQVSLMRGTQASCSRRGPQVSPVGGGEGRALRPAAGLALAQRRSAFRENTRLCLAENLEISRSCVPPRAPNSDKDLVGFISWWP